MSNVILGSDGIAIRQGIYEESATKKADLGRFIEFEDGRVFRYTKNGAGGIGKGKAAISPALVANHYNEVQTGYGIAAGAKNIEVLLTTTAPIVGQYEDGYLSVDELSNPGQIYRIKKHDTGINPCKIELYDPVVTAVAATGKISLIPNKFNKVVILNVNDGAPTGVPVGIPLIDVTADYFFWAQTRGYAAVLVDTGDTMIIGHPQGKPHTHADAGALGTVKNDGTDVVWGYCVYPAAATKYAVIDLALE